MDNIVSQSANAKVAATTGLFKLIAERHRLHRGSVSAAEYKYPVLGLVFLKYVSDMFDAHDSGAKPEGDERDFLGREKSPRRIVWHELDAARHLKSRRGWAGTCGRGTR
jgi:type I restriction-modification system DNA methylase subunit